MGCGKTIIDHIGELCIYLLLKLLHVVNELSDQSIRLHLTAPSAREHLGGLPLLIYSFYTLLQKHIHYLLAFHSIGLCVLHVFV